MCHSPSWFDAKTLVRTLLFYISGWTKKQPLQTMLWCHTSELALNHAEILNSSSASTGQITESRFNVSDAPTLVTDLVKLRQVFRPVTLRPISSLPWGPMTNSEWKKSGPTLLCRWPDLCIWILLYRSIFLERWRKYTPLSNLHRKFHALLWPGNVVELVQRLQLVAMRQLSMTTVNSILLQNHVYYVSLPHHAGYKDLH